MSMSSHELNYQLNRIEAFVSRVLRGIVARRLLAHPVSISRFGLKSPIFLHGVAMTLVSDKS